MHPTRTHDSTLHLNLSWLLPKFPGPDGSGLGWATFGSGQRKLTKIRNAAEGECLGDLSGQGVTHTHAHTYGYTHTSLSSICIYINMTTEYMDDTHINNKHVYIQQINKQDNIYIYTQDIHIQYMRMYAYLIKHISMQTICICASHHIPVHYVTLHCIALRYTTLHYVTLRYNKMQAKEPPSQWQGNAKPVWNHVFVYSVAM